MQPNDIEQGRGDAVGFNWWQEAEPDGTSVQEIVDRVQAEWRAERRRIRAMGAQPADAGMWPRGWPHEVPNQPLSVSEAHWTMQRHRGCRVDECPRKAAARHALINAGRMKPDASREY
ncbi:hypothetical protein ACLMAL_17400 [Nocardia sp. CWNU-33]|uniref:hypothetical protein n=1 Tax=Nocardia sp. CWNU-33 TaxID=3392117 RepID=UPI00398E4822